MKLLLGTIPILLYMHLIFRMLYFPGDWNPADSLIIGMTLMAFGFITPLLLVYPCYLERFSGKRPVFLILWTPIIFLAWALACGLRLANARTLLEQPLVIESGILFFIAFNVLYSHVFLLYEKSGFYDWLKTKERLFYNDPPSHIRDFDKTAGLYIGTVLVVIMLSVYVAVDSFLDRRWWQNRQRSAPVQESRIVISVPVSPEIKSISIVGSSRDPVLFVFSVALPNPLFTKRGLIKSPFHSESSGLAIG